MCGSSSTRRASASCCACAGVSTCPPDPTVVARPSGSDSAHPRASTASSASSSSPSSASPFARRRLSASVPTNTWCSCVTSATSRRRSSSGRSTSRTPPERTEPAVGGWMPASMRPRVDLPAPDGPTTASRSPGSRSSETPCSTGWPSR
ncbi:Uncharacterised protein [Mycobacteroides abscessus]|nr:Uncharacterised protein [Mycobacteroides abscessus]